MTFLYRRILGNHFDTLPQAVRELHTVNGPCVYTGMCSAERGSHILSRLLASVLSLPKTQSDMPLRVSFEPKSGVEKWTRYFGKDRFVTYQYEKNGLLYERLNLVTMVFAIQADTQKLSLDLQKILFLGLPVHLLFRPRVRAIEYEQDGVFHLEIHATLPLIGLLITYRGWLKPEVV